MLVGLSARVPGRIFLQYIQYGAIPTPCNYRDVVNPPMGRYRVPFSFATWVTHTITMKICGFQNNALSTSYYSTYPMP